MLGINRSPQLSLSCCINWTYHKTLVPRPPYPVLWLSWPIEQPAASPYICTTGWGPRGDSGSARGRVRATQPAFPLILQFTQSFLADPFGARHSNQRLDTCIRSNVGQPIASDINELRTCLGSSFLKAARVCRQLQGRPSARLRLKTPHLSPIIVFAVCALVPALLRSEPVLSSINPKTAQAFSQYVRATDARNRSELENGTDLLWIDSLAEAERKKAYSALAEGEVQIEQRRTLDNGHEIECPDGLIHHWEAVVYIPGAKLDDVLRLLQDYDHQAKYYSPDVVRSRIVARDGDHFQVFLRFRRQKIVTVVLNTEHDVTYYRDSATRAHSRSSATHVAEVENPDKANEKEKSRADDNGFMWNMETWWRLSEKDGGVYVQSEVVSLTRSIPAGLGWMIGPFVTSIPKSSLTFTMEATRKAVLANLQMNNSK